MSRRVHACISCDGRTRHHGPCAACRRRGVTLVGDQLVVPLELRAPKVLLEGRTRVVFVPGIADVRAPTLAELGWHGTDCPCTTCASDRIPGRYA
jgi:hypothetical protein